MTDDSRFWRVACGWLILLVTVLVGMKLSGYIAWSWWWVLLPFWLPSLLGALVRVLGVRYF